MQRDILMLNPGLLRGFWEIWHAFSNCIGHSQWIDTHNKGLSIETQKLSKMAKNVSFVIFLMWVHLHLLHLLDPSVSANPCN